MDQSPTIDVKNYLPEIHQKYLAYKKENPNNNENKNRFKKGISQWIKSEKLIKKTIKTILSSLRSQNYFLSGWQKDFFY